MSGSKKNIKQRGYVSILGAPVKRHLLFNFIARNNTYGTLVKASRRRSVYIKYVLSYFKILGRRKGSFFRTSVIHERYISSLKYQATLGLLFGDQGVERNTKA